jgi:apolipoprotein D and lipocalin family protein
MLRRWLALLSLLFCSCQENAPLEVAQGVDLERFQGKWFEIAKLPRSSQAGCTATTSSYTLKGEGELLVVNECRRGVDGPLDRMAARAVVTEPDVPAKLSLNFGFAYGDYWIIELGQNYEYAVIGHPTRDYLWILSRTPKLDAEVLASVLERAAARGFPVTLLDYTKH